MIDLLFGWLGPVALGVGALLVGWIFISRHDAKIANAAREKLEREAERELEEIKRRQVAIPRPKRNGLAQKLDKGEF